MILKRITIPFLMSILVLLVIGIKCFSDDKLETLFRKKARNFTLLHYREGNFTNSGYPEYVAFYEDPKQEYEEKFTDIHKVMVYIIKSTKVIKSFDLDTWSADYREWTLEIIKGKNVNLGEWDGFCYVYDFNENGLDEIVFFNLGGSGFSVEIFEYNRGKMNVVLEGPPYDDLSDIETEIIDEKKIVKLYGEGGGDIPEDQRDWYKYSWNAKSGKYEIIDQGVEKWPDS